MRRILVPTDFSTAAKKALDWGVELANQYGSSLCLLHIYQVPNPTGYVLSLEQSIRGNAEKDMAASLAYATSKLEGKTVLESRIHRGYTVASITDIAERENFDLIVMGMKGSSAVREALWGSMAKGVLNSTMVPLLVVPLEADIQPIKKIVFAVDDEGISNYKVVWALTRIATTNRAEVLVYHLDRGKKDTGIDPIVDLYLDRVESTYHTATEQKKIHEGINHFVEAKSADMLCLIRRGKGFFARLFQPSITRKEVFHCKVPLLVLHDEK